MTTAERQDNDLRLRNLQSTAIGEGRLTGGLKVKNAASEITVDVLLSAKAVRFGVEVKAPTEGRQLTRLKWMTRQLAKAPPEALLHVQWDQKKLKSQARISEALGDVACLTRDVSLQPIPAEASPRAFSIEWTQDLQKGKGKAVVLDGIMADLEKFYALVVEGIVAFVPRAPKLPNTAEPAPLPDAHESPVEPATAIVIEPEIPAESTVVTHIATSVAAREAGEESAGHPTPSSAHERATG